MQEFGPKEERFGGQSREVLKVCVCVCVCMCVCVGGGTSFVDIYIESPKGYR